MLARIARNPIFTALHAGIAEWLMEQRTTSIQADGADRAACRAHQRIFRAIAARNPNAAEAAIRKHLKEVEGFDWAVRRARE